MGNPFVDTDPRSAETAIAPMADPAHTTEVSIVQDNTQVIESQRWRFEVTVLVVLLSVLCAEFVVVHALIEHALASGNTALDILHEMTGKRT